jgi:hypothetical protein
MIGGLLSALGGHAAKAGASHAAGAAASHVAKAGASHAAGAAASHAAKAGTNHAARTAAGYVAANHVAKAAVVTKAAQAIKAVNSSVRGSIAFVAGPIGVPVLTGAAGNLLSDVVKDVVKNHSDAEKGALKNTKEAERMYRNAVDEASRAFLEYSRNGSREALERYISAYAKAQVAFEFIQSKG